MAHVKVPVALFQGIFGALLTHPVALVLEEMKKLQADDDPEELAVKQQAAKAKMEATLGTRPSDQRGANQRHLGPSDSLDPPPEPRPLPRKFPTDPIIYEAVTGIDGPGTLTYPASVAVSDTP